MHETSGFFQPVLTRWYSGLSLRTIATSRTSSVGLRGTAGATVSGWSADGRSILYQAKNGLWLLATLQAPPVRVAAPLFAGQWPDYYAEVDWIGTFAWSGGIGRSGAGQSASPFYSSMAGLHPESHDG